MKNSAIKTADYLFMQFRTAIPTLDQVCDIYYPHLSKTKRLEKARNMEFPFACFKVDSSQKSPYFVDIYDLAFVLEQSYETYYRDFKSFHETVLKDH
ncbi:pyocin activator PrtN family protein [Acinetobacter sp. WU_MDCI_Axc73]|nr:pyocin activator PrtN family protein [Acinetobacter sp. WU_MDCI_Axc73]